MNYLNKYRKIETEGATYTGFFYEVVNKTLDDEAKNFHQKHEGGGRMLRPDSRVDHIMDGKNVAAVKWKSRFHDPYQQVDYSAFYMGVTGTIEYKNTNGFLSADQHPLIMINYISLIIYSVFLMYWITHMSRYYFILIQLHWMILIVLVSAFFQSLLAIVYYSWRNH